MRTNGSTEQPAHVGFDLDVVSVGVDVIVLASDEAVPHAASEHAEIPAGIGDGHGLVYRHVNDQISREGRGCRDKRDRGSAAEQFEKLHGSKLPTVK